MKSFNCEVSSLAEGVKILDLLAAYNIFQFENKIKPDYCNAGGIQQWSADCDGEGTSGWEDWQDEDTGECDPVSYLEQATNV